MEKLINVNKTIGIRIKKILKEKEISKYRLEKITGISHSTLASLIGEKKGSCTLRTLMIIIRALGISMSEFFDDPIFESDDLFLD